MKKKQIRKYLQDANDCMEKIEKKIKCMDANLFFLLLGMENYHGREDCYEAATMDTVREYIKMLRTGEMAELHKILDKLKKV